MRIPPTPDRPTPAVPVTSPVRPTAAVRCGSAAGASDVRVTVSDGARAAQARGEASAAKVERLRAAVADGSLRIDAHAIARTIVDEGG